ncbi:MAG: response regulator [Opitutales bacterium]
MSLNVKKILVLDDEENYADMLQKLLQQHHFVVDSATRPEVALKALEDKAYGLVISDYKMPVMDGADFLQRARQVHPELPVILVSGLMNMPELVKVANMGVTLVLEKPLNVDSFIEHVHRFVAPMEAEDTEGFGKGGKGKVKKQYAPTQFFSDRSAAAQAFLQALCDRLTKEKQFFVQTPPGSELSLLAQELSAWKGLKDPKELCFTAKELSEPSVREAIREKSGKAPFIPVEAITEIEKLTTEELPIFLDFVNEGQFDLPESEHIVFLYAYDPSWLDSPQEGLDPDYMAFLEKHSLRFPRLRDRASDVAHYVASGLTQANEGNPVTLTDAAVGALLLYDWPGNYAELSAFTQRLAASGLSQSIDLEPVLDALGLPEPTQKDALLATGLTCRQQAVLKAVEARSPDLVETLTAEAEVKPGGSVQTQLLFPSLAQ